MGAFDIKYMPQTSIKRKVLADSVVEFTESLAKEEDKEHSSGGKQVQAISQQGPLPWRLYVDDVANQRGTRAGLVIMSPDKITIEKSLRLGFSATNNEAV